MREGTFHSRVYIVLAAIPTNTQQGSKSLQPTTKPTRSPDPSNFSIYPRVFHFTSIQIGHSTLETTLDGCLGKKYRQWLRGGGGQVGTRMHCDDLGAVSLVSKITNFGCYPRLASDHFIGTGHVLPTMFNKLLRTR